MLEDYISQTLHHSHTSPSDQGNVISKPLFASQAGDLPASPELPGGSGNVPSNPGPGDGNGDGNDDDDDDDKKGSKANASNVPSSPESKSTSNNENLDVQVSDLGSNSSD